MLREDQIQRYSRQILLREVGGRGQERLLAAPVLVRDASPALDVAVAYLVAGGTPVVLAPGVTVAGFLDGASLDALSPDAASTRAPALTLGVRSIGEDGTEVVVTAGSVAWRAKGACAACWAANPPVDAVGPSVVVGALAALVIQRLVLGRADPLGAFSWDGHQLRSTFVACSAHQISQ